MFTNDRSRCFTFSSRGTGSKHMSDHITCFSSFLISRKNWTCWQTIQISDNNQKNHFNNSSSILFQVLKKWGRRESERYAKREADPTISEPGTGYSSLKTTQNTTKALECSREWSSQWLRISGGHIQYTNNGQASICIYCGCSLVFLRQLCWELTAGRTRFADRFQIWKFKGPKNRSRSEAPHEEDAEFQDDNFKDYDGSKEDQG